MKIDGHQVAITHPDKVMFPGTDVTKQVIFDYYARIFPYMEPFIRDRPLVLTRYVEGIGQEGFYQKEAGEYFPKWIKRVPIQLVQGGVQHVVVADSAATLAYLANQGTITFHIWSSTTHSLHKPDVMVFDLDPSDNDFQKVIAAARLLRVIVEKHGYAPQLMTTGSRGLHLIINIEPKRDFDDVRAEAHAIAEEAVAAQPDLTTIEARKAKRGKRVYIDVTRNAYGQTHVAPYSLRARDGAPIATPLTWDELTVSLSPKQYTIHNIFHRLGAKPNPWHV
jgi:bifunctional non-homologous end joining protein LigD